MDEDDNTLYFQSSGTGQQEDSSHSIFEVGNIIYKLTHPSENVFSFANDGKDGYDGVSTSYRNITSDGGLTDLKSGGAKQRHSIAMPKWKLFGRQFLSLDVMFDALFLLSKHDSDIKLRVPLSALVHYKGFRCIAIGQIPILPQRGPDLGFHHGNYIQAETELGSAFANVGEALNLKENNVIMKQ